MPIGRRGVFYWVVGGSVIVTVLRQYALGWVVKGFFFPLMFTYLIMDFTRLLAFSPSDLTNIFARSTIFYFC